MVIVMGSPMTSTAGVVIKGNVYGGGNAADVGTDATVNISAGQIGDTQIDDEHGNVFGGGKGQVTTVVGDVKVNIGKKVTIDNEQEVVSYSNNDKVTIKGSIYGGSALGAVNGTKANNWDENHLDRISATSNKTTEVNICAGIVNGNVYGGGRGALAVGTEGQTGYIAPIEAKSFGAVDVSIGIATASAATTTPVIEGSVYGGSNINGTLESSARLDIISGTIGKENTSEGDNPVTTITGGNVHGGGFGQPTLVKGSVIVNIGVETNATPAVHYGYASILADVYGGSAKGNVNATATGNNENPLALTTGATTQVNLYGGTVSGDLYGGGLGDNTTNAEIAANVYGPVTVSTKDGTVRNVFGCNNLYGAPKSTVNVNIDGGTISNDVYGGGNLANTTASPNVSVTNGTVSRDVYGGGALANTGGSTVNITGGTITRDIYGGGLGDADHAAAVNGAVLVNIGSMQPGANEGDAPTYSGNATIGGSVYGCNNANGSPTGNVLVNIYKTAHTNTPINNLYPNGITTLDGLNSLSNDDNRFAIKAVYGGGNLAHYTPVAPTGNNPVHSTTVHVYGCSENTVKAVYGGGNAADVGTSDVMANTNVIIEGGRYDIVFGGGNGYSETGNHSNPAAANYNPGANIFGTATTEIQGGLYNQIYGGSNQRGNVTATSLTINMLCNDLLIDKSFGGANEANITGDVTTTLACSDIKIGSFYGGSNKANIIGNVTLNVEGGTYTDIFGGSRGVADDPSTEEDESISADISGDVTLNLYGGTMDNAFGGSDINGLIGGKITVNMLDRGGECPLMVHNIYGGGRDAAYTPTTPGAYPEVNLIHGRVSKNGGNGGNVFGGGLGSTATVTSSPKVNVGYDTSMSTLVTSLLPADTQFTTANVTVDGDVYGGGEEAAVTGGTTVIVQQGTAEGMTITTAVGGDVYGGGALANVGSSSSDATQVTIAGGTITGNVYGGGLGRAAVADDPDTDENEAVSPIAALVNGAVTVNVNGGTVADVFGCNNVNGAPQSTVTVNINNNVGGNVYGGGNLAAYTGSPAVNINNGTVTQSVYGGGKGATAIVTGNPIVTIGDNTSNTTYAIVSGNVYGGGDAAAVTGNTSVTYNDSHASSTVANLFGGGNAAGVSGNTSVTLTFGKVTTAMYGGCNTSGTVGGTSTVTVTGGTIGSAFATTAPTAPNPIPNVLFGGGKGSATSVTGKTTLNVGTKTVTGEGESAVTSYAGTANIYGNVYGGSEEGEIHAVDVNLYGNTIYGNVFGGGYQTASGKTAATTVNVILDGTKFDRTYTGTAQIFGCNNLVGTPLGQVNVHVFRTAAASNNDTYHVAAVYGGGNEADYVPTTSGVGSTQVIIEGCNQTSIDNVYGGGNAAAVPGTEVWILGSTIINNVYGGGNGERGASYAAHVGFHRESDLSTTNYSSGTGKTEVNLVAGTINDVYGGSNSNGDIRNGADVKTATQSSYTTKYGSTPTPNCCSKLVTQHIYGGGSQAEMSGDVNVILECLPEDYVEAVYGGAANATINGNVSLTVTSGKFGRVFGGNNDGGSINGTITVNVYEDGCDPLIIGELYGAGNNAPYSIYGCTPPAENSPEGTPWTPNTEVPEGNEPYVSVNDNAVTVNVFSCTSIGKVYGGGKGSSATVIGNTHVWINMLNGIINGTAKTKSDDNYIGKIGQVFGGGSAADVIGSTTIDIGTATVYTDENSVNKELIGVNIVPGDDYLSPTSNTSLSITDAGIYGGGEAANVDGNTTLNIGTKNLSEHTNITGNIFGGGLGSGTHVTGNITVNIGADNGTASAHNYVGYANITGDVYGGSAKGKVNSYLNNSNVETLTDGATTQVNLYGGAITGNVYGGGLGDASNAADVYGAVTVNVKGGSANNVFGCNNENGTPKSTVVVNIDGGRVYKSVYGGGNQAIMDGSPVVNVTAGTIGTDNDGNTVYGGAVYGNVYGGGLGSNGTGTQTDLQKVMAGLVKGNTEINISGGTILHNIYGGGAYGSVGTYTYDNSTSMPTGLATANTGKATIYITGGTIGTDGNENGMVFGSSRGDVGAPGEIHDKLAWVYDTHVVIGNTTANATVTTSTPLIKGSVYGGGENGHNYNDALVRINGGTIGIAEGSPITNPDDAEHPYTGAAYPYRGNVYGGGCGTDKYYSNPTGVANPHDGKGDTYNQMAGIVRGTTTVLIDGGQVVRNVYGAGAMGSVGTIDNTGAIVSGGSTSITISGGIIGVSGSDGDGNVFGAARGNSTTTQQKSIALVKTTGVTISGTADVKGSVYGGGEIGNVGTYTTSADGTNTYPEGSGVCAVTVSGGTVRGNVFGAGKGIADSFTSERAMVNLTSVTISNGSVEHNVYGGGEIGRVENNTVVVVGDGDGVASGTPTSAPVIEGNVFGGGQGVNTHGYSGLVRGNSSVTITGNAKVRQNVYGGGETATVGKYWIKGADYDGVSDVPTPPEDLPSGMPYETRAGGLCTVTIQGYAQVGPDAGASETAGHVFGAGKGVEPSYSSGQSKRMNNDGWVTFTDPTGEAAYLQFLETLALVSNTDVTIGGNATVKGNVYGGSESGYVQDHTDVKIQGGTIGTNVYGGGKGLATFAEAGKVKGATSVAISGGTTNGNVYGGGELGYVKQNVTVTVSGGRVVNDVYGGGALADTNTDNWDANSYEEVSGLTAGTSVVTGLYTRSDDNYTLITTANQTAAENTTYYQKGTWASGKNNANNETTYKTIVNLTGGIIGNAYGGGLGRVANGDDPSASGYLAPIEATVYGDVAVTVAGVASRADYGRYIDFIDEDEKDMHEWVPYTGRIFGANNVNGTPKGNIKVTVNSTKLTTDGTTTVNTHTIDKWELHSVYGGGNLANYLPANGKNTEVEINGCDATSIQYVYGGGNSASVPQTKVTINSCFQIGYVFGGGNGFDPVQGIQGNWGPNPGADVKQIGGVSGTGQIIARGGTIGWIYGGSNKKGICGHIDEDINQSGDCPLRVTHVYGAGKNADIDGSVNIVIKCPGNNVDYVYGGSLDARIGGDVTMTIIGGQIKNVFGGNDAGGSIGGQITVNVQETHSCQPVIIENLYGGGNLADYPNTNSNTDPKITVNVKSCTWIGNIYGGGKGNETGTRGIVTGDTEVNINLVKGYFADPNHNTFVLYKDDMTGTEAAIKAAIEAEIPNITVNTVNTTAKTANCTVKNEIGTISNVYGGGDAAAIHGNTIVNIGNKTSVPIMRHDTNGVPLNASNQPIYDHTTGEPYGDGRSTVIAYDTETVRGAKVTENVFGGGNLADVTGITNVNICAEDDDDDTEYAAVSKGAEGVTISGSVYGGGKGRADNFECDKAMVGTNNHGEDTDEGNTYVRIGNGTVGGNVYGGGKVGRVESHTNVTIGYGDGVASGSTPTSAPVITGYVFGAGEGVATHGYSGLVRGNSTVVIQGKAEVGQSVYGGGQKATVGRFWVKNVNDGAYEHKTDYPNVPTGMPYARMSGGACSVTIQGYAKIGPDDMQMPTFSGHVFGAGKGLTPYVDTDTEAGSGEGQGPGRWYKPNGVYTWQSYAGDNKESDYLGYIQTLALADATDVTIAGHAFIKGSVYGGSENGRVLDNTDVKIQEDCQIGNGWNNTANEGAGAGVNRLYTDTEWGYDVTTDATKFLYECNSWPYTSPYAPYDKFNYGGGSENATDGHTFYGNVFGGGSGYFPYASGKWHSEAGAVGGNTTVTITGGHILTSVYGGNELTDVTGSCTVNFGGTATLGVPRTLTQIANHPVTCYLFGAGKGDQRTHFNTSTNVNSATVNVTGGIIYGSVFGGGEDGHILENAAVNISDNKKETSHVNTMIGTWGTSYVDGNVFGGGRGFSGEAQTAGTVGGNVTVTISGGTMLGSIYGGGRLASVGTYFTAPNANEYGQLKEDGNGKTYGHITLNIYGGTIGGGKAGSADDLEAHRYDMGYSGNVYGGCMGRITQIDGVTINPIWPELAQSKFSTVNIYGNNTHITRNVYGGAEFGVVRENAKVTIGGKQEETGTTTTEVSTTTIDGYVYGGGHGSDDYQHPTTIEVYWGGTQRLFTYTPMQWTGCVGGNTTVNLAGGSVKRIYGGGELASVGVIDYGITENANGEFTYKDKKYSYTNMVKHESLTNGFGLSWPYKFTYVPCNPSNFIGGLATVNVTGGTVTEYVYGGGQGKVAFTGVNDIEQQRYTEAFCANVKETQVTIGKSDSDDTPVIGPGSLTSAASVYGGGEDGHVLEDASVIINKGTIGHSVFGGGKGVSTYTATLLDPTKDTPTPKGSSESVHSWTAGKVYGNTNVTMNGGSVGWFIYGGGNMASVGKGNYTGGSDDYSTGGYGETITGNLWTSAFDPNEAVSESNKPDDAYYFLSSGKATVNLFGGTIGDADATAETAFTPTDKLPYGSVFGGSRGTAAMDIDDKSPRYKYVPDSYCGYVNKTVVNIGGTTTDGAVAGDGPTILGSVYGGAQDGHVRNSTEVRIFKGNIAGRSAEVDEAGRSGHVFGAGSGIGTYGDNKVSYSSGSVTCTTLVEMNGGSIHGNIWGGGAMASIGPQMIGSKNEQHAVTEGSDHKSVSYTKVDVKGGSVGGNVYGASRGPSDAYLTTIFGSAENYDKTKYATDIWSFVNVTGGTVSGSVYGGGEGGIVKHDTEVSLTGGTITNDAYGGGKGTKYIDANVLGNATVELNKNKAVTEKGCIVNRIFGCNDYKGTPKGHVLVHVYATQNKDASKATIADKFALDDVNLSSVNTTDDLKKILADKIKVAQAISMSVNSYQSVYNDASATVEDLKTAITNISSDIKTNADTDDEINDIKAIRYDVAAVYGGGNLAPYEPYGPAKNDTPTDYKATTERTEVIIDGCQLTSIKQVYGGGNAAPVPASYLEVNGTYEIDEAFGGGNGADEYEFDNKWYQNPGANVGYYNYTTVSTTTEGHDGSTKAKAYPAVENTDAATKELRQQNYSYGSGIATTEIKGGKIHNVYGGSNKKGNISTTALSMYESMYDDCPIDVDESYGGGKDAPIDGNVDMKMECAHGVKEMFGGAKNADVNSDINLTITNGSSLDRVFGGNNTSGAIAGSITVNIEEGGCEPIRIGELYAGGYLAPYSVYGYPMGGYGVYETENIDYGGDIGTIAQRIPHTKESYEEYKTYILTLKAADVEKLKDSSLSEEEKANIQLEIDAFDAILTSYPKKDPRINVISATSIGNIYGGGYRAKVVGNPHVNINMTNGKVEVENKGTGDTPNWQDANGTHYNSSERTTTYYVIVNDERKEVTRVEKTNSDVIPEPTTDYEETEGGNTYVYKDALGALYKHTLVKTRYWVELPIGEIGNIYGGGNLADIVGDTYVEIGTGKWLTWDAQGNPVWETTDASGHKYASKQTGNAVNYTQAECSKQNAELRGYIPSGVKLSAEQASAVNTALELTGENAYVADNVIYTEDAALYNAKLSGFWTTAMIKTPAVLYKEGDEIPTGKQIGDVKTPAVYYTQAECNEHNKTITGYIACATALTAKQAVAVNEAISANYASGDVIYTEDAAAYIATLNGHISTTDVKTPAAWTWYNESDTEQDSTPTPARKAAKITGNVFGGGKGKADTFQCEKAMVGVDGDGIANPDGGTNVTIANGTVGTLEDGKLKAGTGNVYGGGMIGRVEKNTMVTIGVEANDAPVIYGDVFGAGQGVETHGYSALVRGNPTVIVQSKSKVLGSVYGGGEIASVARYKVVGGSPVALANKTSGNCKVIIRGNAEIGPDNMKMYHTGVANDKPDDTGHVFGAGKGVLPKVYSYADADTTHLPKRMLAYDPTRDTESNKDYWGFTDDSHENIWQYFKTEADYLGFIETLALSSKTDVTISDNAFVKGSVYGGSLNGIVQYNTHVTIEGDCQIGQGQEITTRYKEFSGGNIFESNTPPIKSGSVAEENAVYYDLECAHWDYDKDSGAPHDEYAKYLNPADKKYYYDEGYTQSARGGSYIAKDGHTYYGNVFGGGSGVIPYAPGKWHRAAGVVRGNTVLDITGGHILTSIYGGNEHTDVGMYDKDISNEPTIPKSGGLCTVNFGGTATLGVPRTLEQIAAHPVTCYLFGAGKGDTRTFFNTWTNIREAEVNITGGRIYGSVFGGGEDGHVMENVTVNINESDYTADNTKTQTLIGTTGTSYVDGNVFGAGRGFTGDAITAGSIGGNVEVNISGGTMLGSVYGGGRLASVGIGFNAETDANYGQFKEDEVITPATYYTEGDDIPDGKQVGDEKEPAVIKTYGHITMNISGGIIGHDINFKDPTNNHTTGGNVYGGSMGRLELLDGKTPNPLWPQLGQAKTTTVNINGGEIMSNVYGGGEMGTVRDKTNINIIGGTVNRDVYGGGYGSSITDEKYNATIESVDQNHNPVFFGYSPMKWAGIVGQETNVNIRGGRVKKNVYGGGEMASVGIINYTLKAWRDTKEAAEADGNVVFKNPKTNKYAAYATIVKHADEANSFALSWPYKYEYFPGYDGKTNITITGGRVGLTSAEDENNPFADKDNGDVYGGGKGLAGDYYDYFFCANVGSSEVTINYPENNTATPTNYLNPTSSSDTNPMVDCVAGAVYGGAENGHVMGDTKVTLTNGLIGHSLYGGGSGKGQFTTWLKEIPAGRRSIVEGSTAASGGPETRPAGEDTEYKATCYSIAAGKVFGNTSVEMDGGYVVRNIYGGGNMGSVGKGNYAGGPDDYSTAGYGEKLTDNNNLWDGGNYFSQAFLNSGKCTVKITGGTVGYVDPTNPEKSMYPLTSDKKIYDASLPYGSVFGGCRGESAPNILESPRYLYCPEFFVGYANETEVTIGKTRADFDSESDYTTYLSSNHIGEAGYAPRILGSVYGGGQDGHIRRDAAVTVYSGEIGLPFTYDNRLNKLKTIAAGTTEEQAASITEDLDNLQWLARGNVYGAGSGIGKYKYDINYDGDFGDVVKYTTPGDKPRTSILKEEDFSTSAGSVTRFTTVNINGGIIHRNVYGGGSLSTVGAPKILQDYLPYRKGDTAEGHGVGKQSLNRVNIAGTIGTPNDYQAHYGGEVYGASRGNPELGENFSNTVWTEVNIKNGAEVKGNVFGGGDSGPVTQDTEVIIGVSFATDAPESMSFTKDGGNETFTITTDANWEVFSNAKWLTVTPVSGKGEGASATVTVTATANTGEGATARTATITITGAGDTKTIKVTQAAPTPPSGD